MKFDRLESAVTPLLVDHIDTDQIIPARFLRTVNREGLADHLFADWRKNPDFALLAPEFKNRQILLAGQNFGCGSSREHAPWALLAYGFRVVIARSFADIFKNNALRNGLLPIEPEPVAYTRILERVQAEPAVIVDVDLEASVMRFPDMEIPFVVDAFGRDCLLRGIDRVQYLLEELPAIEAFEAHHV